MAIENDFTKAIEKAFAGRQGQGDHRLVPSVSKGYNAPSVSKKLTIDATKSINEVSPEGKNDISSRFWRSSYLLVI